MPEEATLNSASTASTSTSTPPPSSTSTTTTPAVKELLFKILVVGDLGTGKTSIIKRYVHNIFSVNYKSTIGVDFALKVLQYSPDIMVRLQLWDIAGQERFGNMTRVYYKEAVGALVVYDVTRQSTFEGVSKWKADLDEKVRLPDGSSIPVILLANKVDLGKDAGALSSSPDEIQRFCTEKGFIGFYETSAKENQNISEALRDLVTQVIQNDRMLLEKGAKGKLGKSKTGNSGVVRVGGGESSAGAGGSGGNSCC